MTVPFYKQLHFQIDEGKKLVSVEFLKGDKITTQPASTPSSVATGVTTASNPRITPSTNPEEVTLNTHLVDIFYVGFMLSMIIKHKVPSRP